MLVCIDLSALYFTIRKLGITVNYEKLTSWLKSECSEKLYGDNSSEAVELHAFTVADPKNTSQTKFLDRLASLGFQMHVYSFTTKPCFSIEMAVTAALSDKEKQVFMTNDDALMRSFGLLKGAGKDPALCFFSEALHGNWTPKILSREVKFTDLSDPTVRSKVSS